MNVLQEKTNALLKRKEVVVESEYPSNPGMQTLAADLAAKFKVEENLVCVKHVGSSFGSSRFHIDACIYDSEEAKSHIEPKPKKKGA